MPFAYIVECSDGSYYVGSTWDLERRIGEHNEGLGAQYTRRRRPVRLVWSVQLNRIDEAFRVEKQVQGWGRAKRQALIDGRYDDLPNLARTAQPRDHDHVVSTSSTDEPRGSGDPVVSTGSTHEPPWRRRLRRSRGR
jgi:putative endonuclease